MVANRSLLSLLLFLIPLIGPGSAAAQVTTGTITGRVVDAQGAAIPGVSVHAANGDTGFGRDDLSDAEGTYRLAALPVGTYAVRAEVPGFTTFLREGIVVNVATTLTLDVQLQLAGVRDEVTVVASAPPVETSSPSIGQVVDLERIQALPLNGRQFANLAATVPGVGLGFHPDVTRATQYAPQIGGGGGRNVNYIVDGGDNNDDTTGGLLQMYPLEAIQEFDVRTHRFDAEYGRSNGAVLNVVTRSGTNDLRGSWFTLMRDDALNGRTFAERRADVEKQPYRRYQFGGSVGGPIVRDNVHYFGAYERTQQDTSQLVTTLGLFPAEEGVLDVPVRQDLFSGKVTAVHGSTHYLAARYARDGNSQPTGTPRTARSSWASSTNAYDSFNVNHNWVVGGAALNEFVFQYSHFLNEVAAGSAGPILLFPNDVRAGAFAAGAQSTEQTKWQYRNDFSWTASGFGGLSHEVKTGVTWTHEPTLAVFSGQGLEGIFIFGTLDTNGPITTAMQMGGNATANLPLDLVGFYGQDVWRVTERLTLNLGVRWDYARGMPIDQSVSPNFLKMQAAGRAGRFEGTLLEDFGQEPRADKDNIQPRVGAVYSLDDAARNVVRGGWGIYTDVAYTNSNALVAAFDASLSGVVFSAVDPNGLRKQDGTLFRTSDPLTTIAHLNGLPPGAVAVAGEVVSPLLEQPYSLQANVGWAHRLTGSSSLTADYVRVDGRALNMRVRPNVLVNGRRFLADVGVLPNNLNFRVALSEGTSRYDALILALRRRMSRGLDVTASYTLAKATSDVGGASDDLTLNLIQDIRDPFADVQQGPSSRTDSRHAVTISAIVEAPWGISIAPIVYYRSALPVHTIEGIDFNADGNIVDITPVAYRYTGMNDAGLATYEEAGACETVNCSRRASFSQVNLRVSKSFAMPGGVRLEALAEMFNVFNAANPVIGATQRRVLTGGAVDPRFMQPTAFAGDVGQPEQRVGQVGFRVTF